jgi:hypothetical protein
MPSNPPAQIDPLDAVKRQSLIDRAIALSNFSGDTFRWTLGALLVVNGGAVLAVLNSDDLRGAAFNDAGIPFGIGLLLAVLAGSCWSFALGGVADQLLKRAWDPASLQAPDALEPKQSRSMMWLTATAFTAFVGSLAAFVMGCETMIFVPDQIRLQKAVTAYSEATDRYAAAVTNYRKLAGDRTAPPEQVQAALDRATTLGVEADIAGKRAETALKDAPK